MAEPGPDCSSLLDEDLSSFVFSYLADSQVGSAGCGGGCVGSAVRCSWRGGTDGRTDGQTPPLLAPRRCAGQAVCRALRRSGGARGSVRTPGAVLAPRGAPGAPGRPQPRGPAGAFSTTRTWTPAPPHSPLGRGFAGDKLVAPWVWVQKRPPRCCKGGEGAARCGR